MKIAIFHNLPKGGAKRMVYSLIKELSKSNDVDEFTVSTSTDYLDEKRFVKNQMIYEYRHGSGVFESVFNSLTALKSVHRRIARDINEGNYDIVLVNHDFITRSPYLLRYLRVPSIYFCHEPPREFYEKLDIHSPRLKDKLANIIRFPLKYVDKTNFSYADVVVTNSIYSQSVVKRIYKKASTVIYPGVDTMVFRPQKIKKENQIITVGSLLPYKGTLEVIRCLGTINNRKRPGLIVVGEGRKIEIKKVNEAATKYKVNIKIVKNVSDRELSNLYSSSRVVVSLAFGEPFGLSIIEGMACGIPAVVVNEGGLKEQTINGVNGYVTSRNHKVAGKKIMKAINRSSLGENAREWVRKNRTWKITAKAIINLATGKKK